MDSSKNEFAALARVHGPIITDGERMTAAILADMDRTNAQIAAKTPAQRYETSQAVLRAIVKPADAEAVRSFYWNQTSEAAKMVAMMCAKLDKKRAKEPLKNLNAIERSSAHGAIERLIEELRTIQKCMNGGHIPASAETL